MAVVSNVRRPSARETAVSLAVIGVLAAIVAWLAVEQRHYSPAVQAAVDAACVTANAAPAAATTRDAVANGHGQQNGTPPIAEAMGADIASSGPRPGAHASDGLLTSWPAGLRPMSALEVFTADTLSDKIDGKAELYLAAGVRGMRCQRVSAGGAAWFEAFVYDMGTPENAYAVYSSQKRNVTADVALGDYGYRAGNQLCCVHGSYYLEFVAADATDTTASAAVAVGRALVATLAVTRHANVDRDRALFPDDGLIADSVMLLSADVFGFDQLTNTYVARYHVGKEQMTLFLSRRGSVGEARRLATAVRGFLVDDCGGRDVMASGPRPAGTAVIDSGGSFDAVFSWGVFVAGVRQAPTAEEAVQRARTFAEHLERTVP